MGTSGRNLNGQRGRIAKFLPWASFLVVTYLLVVVVVGRLLATNWSVSPFLLMLLTSLLGVFWSAALAAALSSLEGTRFQMLIEPVLGPRGLAFVGLLGVIVFNAAFYETRVPVVSELLSGPFRDPAPYVMFRARPGYEAEGLTITRHGFRGPEWPDGPKNEDELRVAVLGGSAVFNGLTDERTIPSLLARALSTRLGGRRVVGMNGGVVSANSTQELVLLVTDVLDVDPDVVVVLDGFNDIWSPLNYDDRVGYPYNFMVNEAAWRAYVESDNVEWLVSRSRVLQRIRRLFDPNALAIRDPVPLAARGETSQLAELPGRAAELYLKNWRKMAQICDANGIDCLFALQPTLLYRRPLVGAEQRIPIRAPAQRAVREFYARVEREIGAGPEARTIRGGVVLSLGGMFENYPIEAYWDEVHVFDEGNALIAHRLADVLCSRSPQLKARCP